MLAHAEDHDSLSIRAYGRDERDAQLLSKLWRFVWYEDSGPTLYLTRLQQVEHEAYAMLLARQAGAPVPHVLAAATAGPGTAVLVERHPEAVELADDTVELTDDVLDDTWSAVVALETAQACGAPTNAANSRSKAATSGPCVTQELWMFSILSKKIRASACIRKYSATPVGCFTFKTVCCG